MNSDDIDTPLEYEIIEKSQGPLLPDDTDILVEISSIWKKEDTCISNEEEKSKHHMMAIYNTKKTKLDVEMVNNLYEIEKRYQIKRDKLYTKRLTYVHMYHNKRLLDGIYDIISDIYQWLYG